MSLDPGQSGSKSNGPYTKINPVSPCETSMLLQKLQKNCPQRKDTMVFTFYCLLIISVFISLKSFVPRCQKGGWPFFGTILKFGAVNLFVPSALTAFPQGIVVLKALAC